MTLYYLSRYNVSNTSKYGSSYEPSIFKGSIFLPLIYYFSIINIILSCSGDMDLVDLDFVYLIRASVKLSP